MNEESMESPPDARRKFHFLLTGAQAEAVIRLVNGLDGVWMAPRKHPLTTAANALDEQMEKQNRPWERCKTCNGSGWVEDE